MQRSMGLNEPHRRGSHGKFHHKKAEDFLSVLTHFCSKDEGSRLHNRQFLIDVDHTLESLQEQEDTDKNMQITIEDAGPKVRIPPLYASHY